MREAVIAVLVAAFVALWTRLTLRNIFHQPLLRRKNFLGEEVVGSAGLAFIGSAVLAGCCFVGEGLWIGTKAGS
jgi:hypothetical protein